VTRTNEFEAPFVEPLGYQPVEFLDIPPMHVDADFHPRSRTSNTGNRNDRPNDSGSPSLA
jgi:hypothetical protein